MTNAEKLAHLKEELDKAERALDEGWRALRQAWSQIHVLESNASWARLVYRKAAHD